MGQIIREIVWGVVAFNFLVIGAAYNRLIIVSSLMALLIIVWRITNFIKRRKINVKEIPQEVLDDFLIAERRWMEDGETDPNRILWEIAKSKQRGIPNTPSQIGEGRSRELSFNSTDRPELPNIPYPRDTSNSADDSEFDRRPKRNNPKRLFRRR